MNAVPALTERVLMRPGSAAFPRTWRAETRSRLMAGMARASAERGFPVVKVQDVLWAARASRRTFYRHFDNREQCAFATYDAICTDVYTALGHATMVGDESPVQAVLRTLFEYVAAWPTHGRLMTVEIFALGPEGARRHEATMNVLADRLAGCADENAADATRDFWHAALGGVHRTVQRYVLANRHTALPGCAQALADLISAGAAIYPKASP